MPETVTVWRVRLGERHGTPGELSWQEGLLLFDSDEGLQRIHLRDVVRARRLRGTPVLEVIHEREGLRGGTLFYFVPPPPLPGEGRSAPIGLPGGSGRRALDRAIGAQRLALGRRQLRSVVDEWARTIREAG